MALSKYSAKNLSQKLKSEREIAAAKAEEERKKRDLEALERQRQEERAWLNEVERAAAKQYAEKQRELFLNELMADCLDAALNGIHAVGIDINDAEDCQEYLEARGFWLEEQDAESELIMELEEKLQGLISKDLSNLKTKLLKILMDLNELNWLPASASIQKLLLEKNDFLLSKKALLFLSQGLSYYDENQGQLFEDDIDHPKLIKFVHLIRKNEALIREYIPHPPDGDEELWLLKWENAEIDEINDNWFSATNLNWISSKSGKTFFEALLNSINLKIEALSDRLSFDAFEKNGQTILTLDDGIKLKANISLPHLLEIFDLFGYKKKVPKPDAAGYIKNLQISWPT